MSLRILIVHFLAVVSNRAICAKACTIIAVGKDASSSGFPMIGHTDDGGGPSSDVRLIRVPRRRWPEGSMRPLYHWKGGYPRVVSSYLSPEYAPALDGEAETIPIGHIPQVAETWAYWDLDYGAQNEWGLSIGESTSSAKTAGWPVGQPYGHNRVGIEDLTKIALERCRTARCAIKTMGEIAEEQGFYGADAGTPENPDYGDSSEALVIADAEPGELWVFNVMTGRGNASAIWAAQRLPSNHIVAVANVFTIRHLDLDDHENFLYSSGVTTLAEDMGWWSPSNASPNEFDFFGAYGHKVEYHDRRAWRVYNLLSPLEGAKLDPNVNNCNPMAKPAYPVSVPAPNGSVTLTMVMDAYRDHYEGTPYDLTKGMAAGPFGNPNRGAAAPKGVKGQWERAISMHRSSWSFIAVAKPANRSMLWFGYDSPHGTAYIPFYGSASSGAPESFHSHDGCMAKFSPHVAWWAFNLINQYQDLNFAAINKDVRAKAREAEDEAMQLAMAWEDEAAKLESSRGSAAAIAFLTTQSNAFANKTVSTWWTFAWSLVAKFGRYQMTFNETDTGSGSQWYPMWWLRSPEVGYSIWKPDGPSHGVLLTESALTNLSRLPALEEELRELRARAEASLKAPSESEQSVATREVKAVCIGLLVISTLILGFMYELGFKHGKLKREPADAYYSLRESDP